MADEKPETEPQANPETPAEPQTPLLRIIKGDPTPEEIAALVTVVSAMSAGAASTSQGKSRPRLWGAPAGRHRRTHRPGPGAWRAQAR